MTELNKARRNLHIIIESGKTKEILDASREVDKLVLRQMLLLQKKRNK